MLFLEFINELERRLNLLLGNRKFDIEFVPCNSNYSLEIMNDERNSISIFFLEHVGDRVSFTICLSPVSAGFQRVTNYEISNHTINIFEDRILKYI